MFVQTSTIETTSPQPKTHIMNAESGNPMERAWCDECGCGIWLKSTLNPAQTFFKAGLFEQGEIPNPTMENWMKVSFPFPSLFDFGFWIRTVLMSGEEHGEMGTACYGDEEASS